MAHQSTRLCLIVNLYALPIPSNRGEYVEGFNAISFRRTFLPPFLEEVQWTLGSVVKYLCSLPLPKGRIDKRKWAEKERNRQGANHAIRSVDEIKSAHEGRRLPTGFTTE